MWVYYAIIFILFFMAWIGRKDESVSRFCYNISTIFLVAFVGLRYLVGCDYFVYDYHFSFQNPMEFGEEYESLDTFYWILVDAIDYLGYSNETLNIITSIVFFTGLTIFSRHFKNPAGLLAFCFPFLIFALPMSALRQALATGFLFIAFSYMIRERYIYAGLWILFASQFHSSALIFGAFLPMLFFGGSARGWLITTPMLGLGLLWMAGTEAFEIASMRYLEGKAENEAAGATYRTFILFSFGLYFQIFLRKLWKVHLPGTFPLINLSTLMMILTFPASFFISTIADRLGYYLVPFLAVVATLVPRLKGRDGDAVFLAMSFAIAGAFLVWSSLSWQVQHCYAPYSTWIFGVPDITIPKARPQF